jgi:hypothetical protein
MKLVIVINPIESADAAWRLTILSLLDKALSNEANVNDFYIELSEVSPLILKRFLV